MSRVDSTPANARVQMHVCSRTRPPVAKAPRRRTVHGVSEGPRGGGGATGRAVPSWRCPRGGAAPRVHMVDAGWMHGAHGGCVVDACQPGSATPSSRCSAASVASAPSAPLAPSASEMSTTLYAISPREVLICGGGGRGGSGGGGGPACMCLHAPAWRVRACVCLLRDVDAPLAEQRRDRADHPRPVLVDEAEARVLARERSERRVGEVDGVGDSACVTYTYACALCMHICRSVPAR